MANIAITSDAWTEISITSGTIQNISATADIELSAEQTDNSGVVLKPSEIYQWDNETIYARAVTEATGALRVVNFKKAAGGGGYVLPVASNSTLGGVKVGSNLSIDENGVLSATGGGTENYSTTEQEIGTWTNGKPLYKITIEGNISNSSSYSAALLNDISVIAAQEGQVLYAKDGDYIWYPLPQTSKIEATLDNNTNTVNFSCNVADFYNYVITIKYTKSTD